MKIGLLPLLTSLSFSVWGQIDVNSYLGSYASDFEVNIIQKQREFLTSNNFNSPAIRELEFRLRSPQFSEAPDDFRFRVSPINPWERKANKNYTSLLNERMDIEEQVYFLQILSTRYHLLIRLLFIEKRLKFYTSINDESRQLISTYSQMEGRVREVIQLRKSIFENNLRIDGLIGERNEAEYMISRHLNGDNKLLLTGFNTITPTQIQQELLLETESEESLLVLNEKNKLRLAESEWNINKSESFGNIGFFQAEYRSNRGDAFNENLGWQIGFQIPVFNKDNPDLQRRKLDLLEDEIEVKKVEEAVDLNKFEYRNRLKTLLKQYQNVEDELVLLESEFNTEDVAVLLELNDFKTSLNSEKIKLHQEILTIYVYWLSATSRLMGDPLINQLSKEKTLISRPD